MRRSQLLVTGVVLCLALAVLMVSCKKDSGSPTEPTPAVSIGQLTVSPNTFLVNSSTTVNVRLTVPATVKLIDTTVKVYRAGNPATYLGLLYDDGGLATHNDDIKGDNIYNGIFTFYENAAGTVNISVTASVQVTNAVSSGSSNAVNLTVFSDLTSTEFLQITKTQDSAATKFTQLLGGNPNNTATAVTGTTTWLQAQPTVQSVTSSGTTSISILYKSGLYGGLFISQEDGVNGWTRGGAAQSRRSTKSVPLNQQTVGTTAPGGFRKVSSPADLDPKIIGNRSVLIYAPFEAAFAPANEGPKVKAALESSGYEFAITYLSNQSANIAALYNLTSYGYVVLATHGSQGREFATGELVDTNATQYQDTYKAMLKAGKLAIWNNMVINSTGAVNVKGNVYVIRFPFISDLAGTFPNSVILNNSCESTMNMDLANAFTGKGAKTYYGYTKVVGSGFCVKNADTLTKRLAKDLKTTGDSFMAGTDPGSHHAVYEIKGANDVHYPDSLINGDFEYGKLDGWTKEGDGRVISQLGYVQPAGGKYMGIISTGLGYTTATGRIFQTFRVYPGQTTLTVKWNFLSEEFLEYIGSQYQDYYQIVMKAENGTETVLFSKTIDQMAADFGATKEDPGTLISVSPDITFDRGGVYMTGWQTSTFPVSQFAGQRATLILRAGDVGDSIYDTAILLDDVSVK